MNAFAAVSNSLARLFTQATLPRGSLAPADSK